MYAAEIPGIVTKLLSHLPWLAFFLLAGFCALFSTIAVYHWVRYGMGNVMVWVGIAVYGAGALFLLSSMLYSLTTLTT